MSGIAEDPLAEVCERVLAPLVAADGGRLLYVGRTEGVVEVNLSGACLGCPGQRYTLDGVILPALQSVDATVTAVRVAPARVRPSR